MRENSDLFQLTHSLSKSEKRYFKLHASLQSGEKKYLLLFNAIEKQKEENDDELKQLFSSEKFINQLHVAKNYLYKLIIKSLNAFYAEASSEAEINQAILNIQVLYNKSLYRQANSVLVKAKKIAYEYENYQAILQLLKLEKALVVRSEDTANNIFNEEQNVLKKLDTISKLWDLHSKSHLFSSNKGNIRNKVDLKKFKKIISNPILKQKESLGSYQADFFFNTIHGYYYDTTGDLKNSYLYRKKLLELMEAHPRHIKDKPRAYIGVVALLLVGQGRLGKIKDFFNTLQKLKNLPDNNQVFQSESIRAYIFMCADIQELSIYAQLKQYQKAIDIVPEIEKKLEQFSKHIPQAVKTDFYFNIASVYFGTKEYKKSLAWVNMIINDQKTEARIDLQSFARILNLMIHYELGNNDTVEYAIKSAYRFLLRKENLHQLESAVLKFIKKTPSLTNKESLLAAYLHLQKDIKSISKDPLEQNALDSFNILDWVESKIEDLDSK
jgi:hypothetical protein